VIAMPVSLRKLDFEELPVGLAPASQNLKFERADWTSFRMVEGLQQKAGFAKNELRRLVLKQLPDDALDKGAEVSIGELCSGEYFVEDDGHGIDGGSEQIAKLFSIARPMVSTKLLPSRGALGNGLRVVAGAVLASTGSLAVVTRNCRTKNFGRNAPVMGWAEAEVATPGAVAVPSDRLKKLLAPRGDVVQLWLPGDEVRQLCDLALAAGISDDFTRPHLCGVFLHTGDDDHLAAAATGGNVLVRRQTSIAGGELLPPNGTARGILIPRRQWVPVGGARPAVGEAA
jgi:hypothetical protein